MNKIRLWKTVCTCLAISVCFLSMGSYPSSAAEYPDKPIIFVVGNNPGSVQDLVSRRLARLVEASLKVPLPIENRPGGGGIPSWVHVKKQPADGYTLTLTGLSSFGVRVGKAVKTGSAIARWPFWLTTRLPWAYSPPAMPIRQRESCAY